MKAILRLQKKLNSLCEEKRKRDSLFQAFGLCQCHQLDWEINHTLQKLGEIII